ncbi:hypothetical protein QCA50_001054 [Cerrena zonata]|uniref:Uncharacterized protein n=1 Tax=Cerrena zonata TaxID=2478898 RepID=A0AAW0H0F1_9APHY
MSSSTSRVKTPPYVRGVAQRRANTKLISVLVNLSLIARQLLIIRILKQSAIFRILKVQINIMMEQAPRLQPHNCIRYQAAVEIGMYSSGRHKAYHISENFRDRT